jgi:predicted nucleotidyltransferase
MSLIETSISKLPHIAEAQRFTETKLQEMRAAVQQEQAGLDDILLGTYGSYARREASEQSDLDFFVICRNAGQIGRAKEIVEPIATRLTKIAGRKPSAKGAFGDVEDLETMLSNIGGNDDHNSKITRRILFLLEGEWLGNQAMFEEVLDQLLGKYVRDTITSHQLALFLLNDIIRYYRTICVDFEFKTIQDVDPKPWGTRNIKLVFSRKLLYFSGLLIVAETAQRTYAEKMKSLRRLCSMPVADRILDICGERSVYALKLYDEFLEALSHAEVRQALDETNETDRTKEPFRTLKDKGHHFSWSLMSLLRDTYDISHPIHRAIVL